MGLIFVPILLVVAGIYLLFSKIVIASVKNYAEGQGKNVKYWGRGAALVMFLIPFWDWLPTIAAHQYYCATQAGFWNYKTLDQWKRENPGVFETLAMDHIPSEYRTEYDKYVLPDGTVLEARHSNITKKISSVRLERPDGSHGYRLNERFSTITHQKQPIPGLITTVINRVLVDTETNEVMAKEVNVGTNPGNLFVTGKGYKFWLKMTPCLSHGIGSLVEQIKIENERNRK